MIRLKKKFRFEAAHQLPHHDGKCARLHGHSWIGYLVCEGEALQWGGPKDGMLVDYSAIGAVIQPIVEQFLDHHHLNETLPMRSPTSEHIAEWVFEMVKPALPLLAAVIIEETCTSACEYRPE